MASRRTGDNVWAGRVTRRRFVQGLGLGTAGLALGAACGESGSSAPTTVSGGGTALGGAKTAPAAQATAQPVKGGTLRVVMPSDISPKTLPFANSPSNQYMQNSVYDALITFAPDKAEYVPMLAESWKFTPDYGSLTLNLRKGVTWHTGRAFVAEDVKWALQTIADAATGSQMMNFGKMIQKIDTPDANTITLQFDQPRPGFLDLFPNLAIPDPQTWEDSQNGKKFTGTGAFVFKEWVPGDHFTVSRNPNYWVKDLPYLDEVTEKVIPEAQTRLINLQTDAADAANDLEPLDLKQLANDKKYNIWMPAMVSNVWSVGCDVKVPALADKRVRQAIASLIDRKRIVDQYLAFSEPMNLPWPKQSPAYQPELADRNPYDPAKAKQLLSQVSGIDPTVTIYLSFTYPLTNPMAEMLQAELTKLNWKVDIQKLQTADFSGKLSSGNFRGIWMQQNGYIHMSPATMFVMAFPYRLPNGSNFETPAYKQLVDDVIKTGDPAQLKTIYGKINETLLDECFFNTIAAQNSPTALGAKVNYPPARSWQYQRAVWKSK